MGDSRCALGYPIVSDPAAFQITPFDLSHQLTFGGGGGLLAKWEGV